MSDFYLSAPVSYPTDSSNVLDSLQGRPSVSDAGSKNIDAVSQDFEAVFISQMMGAMFSGDELTSYFGGGTAGEIYKSFLLNEYGKSIAKTGGIGIASEVKKELLRLQEIGI